MKTLKINKKFIEEYMENNNIKSITELALNIGVSPATLSRLLNGERNPGNIVIAKMLSYFGIKFEKLFYFVEVLPKVNSVD